MIHNVKIKHKAPQQLCWKEAHKRNDFIM